ncbi:L,D-transpeptidase family protein [Methylobacterium sp. C25]|uniref:L,D-transpeptidase family protein n=1 Tax=Methylobacterium sp. C25 TaxID=2721622 RepID=UPI001F02F707|nr:L,D-transpeptidase family protein [Methylobacterium sp. C25]MCE4225503.1 L,D-transpeptidase family protein [Methylobacterium sp. C25]
MRVVWTIGSLFGVAVLAAIAIVAVDYLQIFRTEPALVPASERADLILVEKGARRLTLMRGEKVLATYPVSLGFSPVGHKQREGDGRTPEGRYKIEYKNPGSVAHLSLKVSYPNQADEAAAASGGYSPGGDIMVHGIMNGLGWIGGLHRLTDWTSGCVGVTNAEMEAIYSRVDVDTPIEIRP